MLQSIDYSYVNDNSFYNDFITPYPFYAYQYSFVGPLSMQKGCDKAFHMYTKSIDSASESKLELNDGIGFETNKLSYRGTHNNNNNNNNGLLK